MKKRTLKGDVSIVSRAPDQVEKKTKNITGVNSCQNECCFACIKKVRHGRRFHHAGSAGSFQSYFPGFYLVVMLIPNTFSWYLYV